MKIVVLNGSPKGDVSVTMQYVGYIRKRFGEHDYRIINAAHDIRRIERDEQLFREVLGCVEQADLVLWAFPLYVCTVHADYHRFVELIWERGAQDCFRGKSAAALSTSIHFFDNTAHNYMHAVCDDLGMRYLGYYSAAMDDLMQAEERKRLESFARLTFESATDQTPVARLFPPVATPAPYRPGSAGAIVGGAGQKILLITDCTDQDGNLKKMAERFAGCFTQPPEVVNLNEATIKGGCLGCIQCGYDNHCVYDGSDDIRRVYDEAIASADIVAFACRISHRNFSSRMKTFIDRRFAHTHQPTMVGKQLVYLLSGDLDGNFNLYEVIQAMAQTDRANLVGVASDGGRSSEELDTLVDELAHRSARSAVEHYRQPDTFLGVGGKKIFRDEIWGKLRFVFQGDHRYYKAHDYYDFPQRDWKTRLTNAVMVPMSRLSGFRDYTKKNMKELMISSYKKVLNSQGNKT